MFWDSTACRFTKNILIYIPFKSNNFPQHPILNHFQYVSNLWDKNHMSITRTTETVNMGMIRRWDGDKGSFKYGKFGLEFMTKGVSNIEICLYDP